MATATDRGSEIACALAQPVRFFGESLLRREADHGAIVGRVRNFSKDCEIYAERSDVRSFYKVVSGVVRTCKFLNDGRRQIESFHSAGDIFGLELGDTHGLSAEAVSDCTIVAYRWRGLTAAAARNEETAPQIFHFAMQCLQRAQQHALLLGRRSAAQRVAAFLVKMADDEEPATVHLAMTRQDIADYLGLTIETVSRTLSQFEREQVITLPSTRHVVLEDRDALMALND